MTNAFDRDLKRRAGQSMFEEDGHLRADASSLATSGQIHLGEYLHLGSIEWAKNPDGAEHCQNLARLVEYIAELPESLGGGVGGALALHDRKVLYAVGMLYATGRQTSSDLQEWMSETEARRSAEIADRFFREGGGSGSYWSTSEVREETCRLIFQHRDRRAIDEDRRLKVFEDALRFETVRYDPNTMKGMALLRERCTKDKFHLGWSKDQANFRGYMTTRGGWR